MHFVRVGNGLDRSVKSHQIIRAIRESPLQPVGNDLGVVPQNHIKIHGRARRPAPTTGRRVDAPYTRIAFLIFNRNGQDRSLQFFIFHYSFIFGSSRRRPLRIKCNAFDPRNPQFTEGRAKEKRVCKSSTHAFFFFGKHRYKNTFMRLRLHCCLPRAQSQSTFCPC